MKFSIIFLAFLLAVILDCSAQKAPIKFGDLDMADMTLKSYPGDSTAPAAILCDYGVFNSASLQFTRILRIKIFTKEGYNWGDQAYPTSSKSMIRGITYNLVNGKIVEEKLKPESIFAERVTEDNYRMRVAMPNVKEGSVLDLMFTFDGIPAVWKFQETIPVRYSELIIEENPYIRFKSSYTGYIPLSVSTSTRWVAKNVPAFKVEPYMDSEENYLTKLEFDILDIHVGTVYKAFSTTWDNIFKNLMESADFGMTLTAAPYLNDITKQIEAATTSKVDRMKLAFEEVKSKIKWNESASLVTSSPQLSFVYKAKTGNSADINLILYQLLKKLGIEVGLVAMSTRDNGHMSMFTPSTVKMNYVIVQAKIDGKQYLLDATEEYIPYKLLPFRCLNLKGRSVKETLSDWVDLVPGGSDKKTTIYDLTLNADMTMKGKYTVSNFDYAALNLRKKYHKFNSADEFIEDFKKDKPGLNIDSYQFDKLDSIYSPVTEIFEVNISDKVNSLGNEIYIQPALFDQMTDNPFKLEKRVYPVDFGYKTDYTLISNITIPEGYTVTALPASGAFKLPANAGLLAVEAVQTGNLIKVLYRISISKIMFLPDEYPVLREFFNTIIKKQSEPIILKKA